MTAGPHLGRPGQGADGATGDGPRLRVVSDGEAAAPEAHDPGGLKADPVQEDPSLRAPPPASATPRAPSLPRLGRDTDREPTVAPVVAAPIADDRPPRDGDRPKLEAARSVAVAAPAPDAPAKSPEPKQRARRKPRQRSREARRPGRQPNGRPAGRYRRRSVSKLTARVLAINVLALLILVGGLLYLGRYEDRLIQAEIEVLRSQAKIFAGALAEGTIVGDADAEQGIDPELARQMVRRLFETTGTRTRLFDVDGSLTADSRFLIGVGSGGAVEIEPLPPLQQRSWLRETFDAAYHWVTEMMPERRRWAIYRERPDQRAADYDAVVTALAGDIGTETWTTESGDIMIGVAEPVQRLRVVLGAVMVTADNLGIDRAIQSVREDILKVFAFALAITILLSTYLASSITRPIRRLAEASDRVRRGLSRQHEIPDFRRRRDEIGDLSGSLRDMTEALWARMDAIERFAADVAHEIKNPLTSLRSAVETTARITDPEQQRRLMGIIVEDVQRLNRLISDISDASRLDAELSRAAAEPVDIAEMLRMLSELYQTASDDGGPRVVVRLQSAETQLRVPGLEGRLVQVFRNLIGNAVSFSPPGGKITLTARRLGEAVEVVVEDDGPGIPPTKLEAIFDRFYSERPSSEKFGTHSGLGLSISKQIVEAHDGTITAENRQDTNGARFTVRVPAL